MGWRWGTGEWGWRTGGWGWEQEMGRHRTGKSRLREDRGGEVETNAPKATNKEDHFIGLLYT